MARHRFNDGFEVRKSVYHLIDGGLESLVDSCSSCHPLQGLMHTQIEYCQYYHQDFGLPKIVRRNSSALLQLKSGASGAAHWCKNHGQDVRWSSTDLKWSLSQLVAPFVTPPPP